MTFYEFVKHGIFDIIEPGLFPDISAIAMDQRLNNWYVLYSISTKLRMQEDINDTIDESKDNGEMRL